MPYDDKTIEDPERDRWQDKKVDRRDTVGMVGQKTCASPETVVARGGNSSSGPEGLTSTSREVVDAGRAATGHAYIGFRCISDALLVL